jgi:hypothetical protein
LTHNTVIDTVRALHRRPRILFAFLLFSLLLVSFEAWAGRYVLRAGREKDILALFAPYTLGSKVAGTWNLWSISIEPRRIDLALREINGHEEHFSLVHPEDATDKSEQTKSFAFVRSSSKDASLQQAASLLFSAANEHDIGGFWEAPKLEGKIAPDESPLEIADHRFRSPVASAVGIVSDGITTILLLWILGVLLAVRLLRESPKWIRIALPTTVLLGIAVRLLLSPPAFLGAWPWSRLWSNIRTVFDGPVFHAWVMRSGQTYFLTDVMMWTNFAYAAAMPLILFSHATYLLRDPRAGMAAAFILAFLPQHIRFSRCEDAFVPSLVLTSLAFALIHAWLRDPSKIVRILALVVMPLVLYLGYLLRPLNILFVIVYCVAMVLLHPETAPKERRVVGLAVVIGVWMAALPTFISTNESTLEKVLVDLRWLGHVIDVMVTPRLLVLTDLNVTPLVLVVLAGAGAYFAWRAGEKRLVLFLGGWLLMFVVAHAVVVNPPMQPRYHMHLVVPFLLLAAKSAPHLWQNARVGLLVAGAVVIASPWLHRHWIRDLHYAEMQEYAFVREAREIIPAGCTVIEYVGTEKRAIDLRFARISDVQSPAGREFRYRVVPAFASGTVGDAAKSLDDVLKAPPACLYLYQGLECSKENDAPECAALRRRFSADSVKQAEVSADFYDKKVAEGVPATTSRLWLELLRVNSVNQ